MKVIKYKEFLVLNESRSNDIKSISNMKKIIFTHFMKIYLYTDSEQYVVGWMKEIEHFVNDIYGVKKGKNVYEYSIYYNNLTYKVEDEYGNINKNVLREVEKIHTDIKNSCSEMYSLNDDIFTCLRLYDKFIDKLYDIIKNRTFDPDKVEDLLKNILDISF
jgi:hypothetical protein